MIVVMKAQATEEMVQRAARKVDELGLKSHMIIGTERTVIAAIGEKRNGEQEKLLSLEGVENVVPISAPYKIASKETKSEPTVVRVRDLIIGGGHVGMIAGPCSVESEVQIMQCARQVKEAGAKALRGGAFKPRTSPYAFQGMKEEGLKLLAPRDCWRSVARAEACSKPATASWHRPIACPAAMQCRAFEACGSTASTT